MTPDVNALAAKAVGVCAFCGMYRPIIVFSGHEA
jgi:hypothetical protein